MPILTPTYPTQNSTFNVQRSNRIIIEREIRNGKNLRTVVDASYMHKESMNALSVVLPLVTSTKLFLLTPTMEELTRLSFHLLQAFLL